MNHAVKSAGKGGKVWKSSSLHFGAAGDDGGGGGGGGDGGDVIGGGDGISEG